MSTKETHILVRVEGDEGLDNYDYAETMGAVFELLDALRVVVSSNVDIEWTVTTPVGPSEDKT